ncbi:MAG: holo-ACP synthase [Chloroflexota bacterium]
MKLQTGIDLLEIQRIRDALSRHGERFLERVYTPAELALCNGRAETLAGRFAAKEAVSKALGCGIGEVGWKEIEILADEEKAPRLHLRGAAAQKAQELGLADWSVSISHSRDHAVAMAVAIGERGIMDL